MLVFSGPEGHEINPAACEGGLLPRIKEKNKSSEHNTQQQEASLHECVRGAVSSLVRKVQK